MLQVCALTPTDTIYTDLSGRVTALEFSTSPRGFEAASVSVRMGPHEAWRLYDRRNTLKMYIGDGARSAFEGRIDDIELSADGVAITVIGHIGAWRDLPYTALWVDNYLAAWREITNTDDSDYIPERYEARNDSTLLLAPKHLDGFKDDTRAGWVYEIPASSARQIVRLDFDYDFLASSPWKIQVRRRDSSLGALTDEWTLTGTGSAQVGTQNLTFTACDAIELGLFYDNAGLVQYAGETLDEYAIFSNVRVSTSTSATLYADEIIKALISYQNGINPNWVSAETATIDAPAVALASESYADAWPADIGQQLARVGDGSQPWWLTVWEDQQAHFRARGAGGQTWYVWLNDLSLQYSRDALRNSAYTVYQGTNGPARTATASNAESIELHQLERRAAVADTTTSQSQAESIRDAFLADRQTPKPRAGMEVGRIYDAAGLSAALWHVRAGDRFYIRGLPVGVQDIENVETFIIEHTRFDAGRNTLDVTPADNIPTLENLLIQREVNT